MADNEAETGHEYQDTEEQLQKYKPADADAKPPRNLTIAGFLAVVTVFYYFLTSFLQEESDVKVIASRVPLLQTMAGCFAEFIFCAVCAGPLKFIRPDLI